VNGGASLMILHNKRRFSLRAGMLVTLFQSGCSMSPSQNILGSFFPSWMLCTAIGIGAAVALRFLFGGIGLEKYVLAPPLTYLSVAVAVTLVVWLIWFGQ
jgi:cation transporter-like permease